MKILFIKLSVLLLFYLLSTVNVSFAQEVELLNSNVFILPDYSSTNCKVMLSTQFKSFRFLKASEASIYPIGTFTPISENPASVIGSLNDTYPNFLLQYYTPIGEFPVVVRVLNSTRELDANITIPQKVICKGIQPENFQITKLSQISLYNFRKTLQFAVEFNFTKETSYRKINCSTGSTIQCTCSILNELEFNRFICNLTLTSSQKRSPPQIEITFTLLYFNYQTSYIIDNPFPWNNIRTSTIVDGADYPPTDYIYSEDFRLQRAMDKPTYALISINNLNSILLDTSPNGQIFLHKKNNSDVLVSFETHQYNPLTQYTLDFSDRSTSSIFSYSSNFQKLNTPYLKVTLPSNTNINTEFAYQTLTGVLPYIHNYTLQVIAYGKTTLIPITSPTSASTNENGEIFFYEYYSPFYFNYQGDTRALYTPMTNEGKDHMSLLRDQPIPNIMLNYINFDSSLSTSYIVTLSVSSDSPIVTLVFSSKFVFDNKHLIDGNEYTGIYQFVIPYTPNTQILELVIYNINGAYVTFYEGSPYNEYFDVFPSPPYESSKSISYFDISQFQFYRTDIDLTNGRVNNTLVFNVSKYVPDMHPYIVFDIFNEYLYQGAYDPNLKLFVINFTMESWLVDGSNYRIGDLDDYIHNDITGEQVSFIMNNDPNSILNIKKTNGVTFSPILYKLSPFDSGSSIGWNIGISSIYNELISGRVEIVSKYDLLPYQLYLNSSNIIEGDMFTGDFKVSLELPTDNCRNQSYIINHVYLRTSSGVVQLFDSLDSIRGRIPDSNFIINHTCTGIPDTTPPQLVSFAYPSSIEVGGSDRFVEIFFSTTDLHSGISARYIPIVYFSSRNNDFYMIESTPTSNNGTHFEYEVNAELPYGFGFQNICISIYGIADNQNNYANVYYPTIPGNPVACMIREFDPYTPFIERASSITRAGGSITLYGKGFPISGQYYIDYSDDTGSKKIIPSFNISTVVVFDNIKQIKHQEIRFHIEIGETIYSNYLNVIPTETYIIPEIPIPTTNPTPTPTVTSVPSICPGTPVCNGRGTCNINYGCECQSPWVGPSCNSQKIIINPPSPQPEPTTGTNVTKNNNLITSIIQILEVREIDESNNIVNTFKIKNWNFTDFTTDPTNPIYLYDSQLDGTGTIISTVIAYYPNDTLIKYGDDFINVEASTIKYSIELTRYTFKSALNSLQIVMESAIQGGNGDSCSSKKVGSQTGSNDDVQWIKINIDNTSLYGKFVGFGIIDNRVLKVTNRIIQDEDNNQNNSTSSDTNTFRSLKVGITVPYYEESVYLDPDFSNLIDVDKDDDDNEICPKSDSKLSTGVIAAIVVAGVVVIAAAVGVTLFLKKRAYIRGEQKRVQNKLKNMK